MTEEKKPQGLDLIMESLKDIKNEKDSSSNSIAHNIAMVVIPGLIILGIGQTYGVRSAIDVINARDEVKSEILKSIQEDVNRLEINRWTDKNHKEYAVEMERKLEEIRSRSRSQQTKINEQAVRIRDLERLKK